MIELKQIRKAVTAPLYIGATCLAKGKIALLDFIYKFLKPSLKKYNSLNNTTAEAKPVYCDTDSFFVYTSGCRFHQLQKGYEHKYFDLSNYSDELLLKHNLERTPGGVLGMWKNECAARAIIIGIFVNPKTYFYEEYYGKNDYRSTSKAAGTNYYNIMQYVKEDYERAHKRYVDRDQSFEYNTEGRIITTKNLEVRTIKMQKKKLSIANSKRWSHPTDCNITLPYGHFEIYEKYNEYYEYLEKEGEIRKDEKKSAFALAAAKASKHSARCEYFYDY